MKHLKKSLLAFVLLATGSFHAYAQDKVPGIIVELANGEKVECRFVDKPKFVFDGSTITLTAEGVKVEYTPAELVKVTTGEVANVNSGINELNVEQGTYEMGGGFVRLKGFEAAETVRVFSASGVLKATHHTSADGSLVISVSSLPSGISIIKTNKQTIKITRR